jgi:hypothetical protein
MTISFSYRKSEDKMTYDPPKLAPSDPHKKADNSALPATETEPAEPPEMATPRAPRTVADRSADAETAAEISAMADELNLYPALAEAPKDIQAIIVARSSDDRVHDEPDNQEERARAAEASISEARPPSAHTFKDARIPTSRAAPAEPAQKEEREPWAATVRAPVTPRLLEATN